MNDTLGHAADDQVLRTIASRFTEVLDRRGILAHIGGDEFVATFCESVLGSSSQSIADKLLEASLVPVQIGSAQVQLGAGIGISLFPRDGSNGDELLQAADAAMYRVKTSGKSGYGFPFGSSVLVKVRVPDGASGLGERHSPAIDVALRELSVRAADTRGTSQAAL